MIRNLAFLLFFLTSHHFFGFNPTYTLVIDKDTSQYPVFFEEIPFYLDSTGKLTLEDFLMETDLPFVLPGALQNAPKGNVWIKFRIRNRSDGWIQNYFRICGEVDSVLLYLIENGRKVQVLKSGTRINPKNKNIPSGKNYLPFAIEPGNQQDYLFQMKFGRPHQEDHFTHIFIEQGRHLSHLLLGRYSWNSFYAGAIFLFGFFSLFLFSLFRERELIYFALLMFSFGAYFLLLNDVADAYFTFPLQSPGISIGSLAITGIVLSIALFMDRYLHLEVWFPRFRVYYLVYIFLLELLIHTLYFFKVDWKTLAQFHNGMLVIFIILTAYPMVARAMKRDKAAVNLLISSLILFLSSFLFLLSILDIMAQFSWLKYSFQLGSILYSATLFIGLFEKVNTIREEKRKSEEMVKLKSRFFANISHEFRTPLTLIADPIKQVADRTITPEDKKLLQLAHKNAGRMLDLVNQLLALSKLESGKLELKVQPISFSNLLRGIVMSFESLASSKKIDLVLQDESQDIILWLDEEKVKTIFYNLLSNAFKFTPDGGKISVELREQEDWAEVVVEDTGIGISPEQLPFIFNRFFQLEHKTERELDGSGIGLALVKELMELHGGTIEVSSQEGKGVSFTLQFLKGRIHFKESQIHGQEKPFGSDSKGHQILGKQDSEIGRVNIDSPLPGKEILQKKQSVLIVEDHPDVRKYIIHHLESKYKIFEAANGEQGIQMALNHLPDLIISDVLMPEKNGFELCAFLKSDPRTSHIPVILLTARTAREEKSAGLSTGADDYLIKPFDIGELEIRVHNLITLREKLRIHFSQSDSFKTQLADTPALDKQFLEILIQTVEENLSNNQLNVDLLAHAVHMSKTNLTRKLKYLTNYTPNKFIQVYRLQKARELLFRKEGNVSEIALSTGFQSTAYFVKCFREKFGQTPGAILDQE